MVELFTWLGATLVGYMLAHFGYMERFWAFCIWIMGAAYEFMVWLGGAIIHTFQVLGTAIFTAMGTSPCGSGIADILALTNTFFPLDETLQMSAAMIVTIWLPIALYRFVKSWIPTLTGG